MSHRRRLCRLVIGVDGLRVGDHDGYTEQPPACRVIRQRHVFHRADRRQS